MSLIDRSLGSSADGVKTSFTAQQNRNILIAGLSCACFSVLATLITLRWFLLMKRTFRHTLIMFLIFSDTFKAFWYFLFPVVVFSRGPVVSSSTFCQVSGFFLALGIETSDFAILMIALHSLIYIFRPPARSGQSGGLYQYRKPIYVLWAGLPLLSASLAFINHGNAYQTAGTFCYLPRRPFWYRLALTWIPRYCVISLIFSMYTAVYIYVAIKFRGFSNLQMSGSSLSSQSRSRRSSMSEDDIAPDDPAPPMAGTLKSKLSRSRFSRKSSLNDQEEQKPADPWDQVDFITSKPLHRRVEGRMGVDTTDFADRSAKTGGSGETRIPDVGATEAVRAETPVESRKVSHAPTMSSQLTGKTVTPGSSSPDQLQPATQAALKPKQAAPKTKVHDPLKATRRAIQKQLRYLFIYPAVYVAMWIFPFVSHCLLYDDYYVQNPIYWLSVITTCMMSLMAGVDCVVFSWREKPWRRIPEDRKISFTSFHSSFSQGKSRDRSAQSSFAAGADAELGTVDRRSSAFASGPSSRATSAHWWEAEGKKRKDSVWMGTDADRRGTVAQPPDLSPVVSRSEEEEFLVEGNSKESCDRVNQRVPDVIHEGDEAVFSTPNWNR